MFLRYNRYNHETPYAPHCEQQGSQEPSGDAAMGVHLSAPQLGWRQPPSIQGGPGPATRPPLAYLRNTLAVFI